MDADSRPLAVAFAFASDDESLTFVTRKGLCEVSGNAKEITEILKRCTGQASVRDVAADAMMYCDDVVTVLNKLEEQQIVAESNHLYRLFHQDVSNVSPFRVVISPSVMSSITDSGASSRPRLATRSEGVSVLDGPLSLRDTTRTFTGEALSEDDLFFVLERMYKTKQNMAVPSPGSIYPTSIYVVLLHTIGSRDSGVYRYDHVGGNLVHARALDAAFLKFVLDGDYLVDMGSVVLLLAADLAKIAMKYANRGYYFSLIEVGHIAQNVQLVCAERDLGVLEYGAVLNEMADRIVRSNDKTEPTVLLAMVLGVKSSDPPKTRFGTDHKTLWSLIEHYVVDTSIITDVESDILTDGSYVMPSHAAYCSYKAPDGESNPRKGFAFAADHSRRLALVKAIAEAVERYYSGRVNIGRVATIGQLRTEKLFVVDPLQISPYPDRRYKSTREPDLVPYDSNVERAWVEGVRLSTGEPAFAMAEQVYYPLDASLLPGGRKSFKSNSTGVAAGFGRSDARERAIYELIERDAFSIFWHAAPAGQRVEIPTLPADLYERVRRWEERCAAIQVVDISNDSIPVFLVIMRRRTFPFFATGCAARLDPAAAVAKAFDEMESTALSWTDAADDIDTSISEEEVQIPRDHGIYYGAVWERSQFIDDLILDLPSTPFRAEPSMHGLQDLASQYDVVEVVLHEPEFEGDFWVVRNMSASLLMLSFGKGNEPTSHPRIYDGGRSLRWKDGAPLHFFP